MAVGIGVTGIGLTRTVGAFLDPSAGNFTFMYWVMRAKPVTDLVGATYQTFTLLGTPDYSGAYVFTGANHTDPANSFDFQLDSQNAALTEATSTYLDYQEPTIWYHVAVTFTSPSTLRYYINGWLVDTVTLNLSASTFAAERIGIETDPSHGGFAIGYYRSWNAALTNAELRLEMAATAAVKATNLFCDTPLTGPSDLTDVSGNARNWSATGALTTVTGPVLHGATSTNTTAANAYDLGTVPATHCQQCGNLATTLDVWYKLTWSAADAFVGVLGLGSDTGYIPHIKVYDGLANATGGTIYRGFDTTQNKAITVPMYQGHVYYFFADQTGNNASPVLQMSALAPPADAVPAGSIAINDDTDGFPLALLSSSTTGERGGDALKYLMDFPAGEDAHILPVSGKLIVNGIGTIGGQGIFVYDVNLVRVAGPIAPGITFQTNNAIRMSSDRVSLFYVCGVQAGGLNFNGTTISSTTYAVVGPTFHPTQKTGAATDLFAIAPSLDNTILYYSTSDEYIQRWDLVNDIALSDLAGPVTNYSTQGTGGSGTGNILVMPDGSIVVAYQRSSTTATKVIQYEANGSIRHSYDYANVLYNHITHDGPSSTTIWMWGFVGNAGRDHAISVFDKIDLTTGTIVQTTPNRPQFHQGGYISSPPNTSPANTLRPDPLQRFGHSGSCDFWITRGTTPPAPPTFTTIEHPIRRLRRAPHLNNENKRISYPGIELDFQRGIGILADPGRNPVFMFRISRDGGRTWSDYMQMHAGEMGQYRVRAMLRRLGYARDAVFEVTVSDPNNFVLTNAWLTPDPVPGAF